MFRVLVDEVHYMYFYISDLLMARHVEAQLHSFCFGGNLIKMALEAIH